MAVTTAVNTIALTTNRVKAGAALKTKKSDIEAKADGAASMAAEIRTDQAANIDPRARITATKDGKAIIPVSKIVFTAPDAPSAAIT